MFNESSNKNHPPICNFVPGYAFYSSVGDSLAEDLVNFFEFLISFIERIRR